MANQRDLQIIREELETGMQLPKCQKCGCMQETLSALGSLLPTVATSEAQALSQALVRWNEQINSGWVTELSHAAYLGKELVKAELSLEYGFKYLQDGA